jgi:repressor of nif and glnA expression
MDDERRRTLLSIVAEGGGRLTARDVDLRVSRRMAPDPERHVLQLLTDLAGQGLVKNHSEPGFPMSRWEITDEGLAALRTGPAGEPRRPDGNHDIR